MANVFIVTEHLFYNQNGIGDIPFAMSVTDISTFTNKDKALEYVETLIQEKLADSPFVEPKFDRYEYTKEDARNFGVEEIIVYSQSTYNSNNVRKSYRIVKQKIR